MNTTEIQNKLASTLANKGITICVLDTDTLISVLSFDDIKGMSKEDRYELNTYIGDKLESITTADAEWNMLYGVYCDINTILQNEYYYENIDAFREYESHMDEPDFDWDFYSDWHKDMYGYRPR